MTRANQLIMQTSLFLKRPLFEVFSASIPRLRSAVTEVLFADKKYCVTRAEWTQAAVVGMLFALLFAVLLPKSRASIEGQLDMHFHQAFLDYDIDWGTPAFALAGNLLNNFGIQVPLNSSLSPILGLARRLSSTHHVVIAVTLLAACFGALFW